jgi:hypothetical protein
MWSAGVGAGAGTTGGEGKGLSLSAPSAQGQEEEDDVTERLDVVTAALNLYRFLLLKDKARSHPLSLRLSPIVAKCSHSVHMWIVAIVRLDRLLLLMLLACFLAWTSFAAHARVMIVRDLDERTRRARTTRAWCRVARSSRVKCCVRWARGWRARRRPSHSR